MKRSKRSDSDNYRILLSAGVPLIDLRAPVEFSQGAFPSSVNLPLMSDEERAKVGSCYKNHGQDAAIGLGNKLVSGKIREQRMEQWIHFVQQHPEGYIYCFRGGLRSRTVQQWLSEEGIDYPLIVGGYKAMRRFLIDSLEELSQQLDFIVIGGRTGTRKTELISKLPNTIDLEGRANHRGSSFGRRVGGQPTVISFENNLAIDLLKLEENCTEILVEDEGVTIGRCSVPESLRNRIKTAPLYLVEASVDERVENILNDYVLGLSQEYLEEYPDEGWKIYKDVMFASLFRIRKRLGGERYKRLYHLMEMAFKNQADAGQGNMHREWIRILLEEYYDPMYDFQLTKKQYRVKGCGSWYDLEKRLTTG